MRPCVPRVVHADERPVRRALSRLPARPGGGGRRAKAEGCDGPFAPFGRRGLREHRDPRALPRGLAQAAPEEEPLPLPPPTATATGVRVMHAAPPFFMPRYEKARPAMDEFDRPTRFAFDPEPPTPVEPDSSTGDQQRRDAAAQRKSRERFLSHLRNPFPASYQRSTYDRENNEVATERPTPFASVRRRET